jgi:transposase
LLQEVAPAKQRCGLPESAPVVSGDEAGRDGFWRHRSLPAQGLTTQVVASSSIAAKRRQRRAKSDGLDVRQWLPMLLRFHQGERDVWGGHVPTVEAEEQRQLHREVDTLQQERARTTTRLQGVRSGQGIRLTSPSQLPEHLEALRLWDGAPLPSGLRRRVLRVSAHDQFLSAQSAAVEAERRAVLQRSQDARLEKGRQLMQLRGIGINGFWLLVRAFFGWRELKNRREVGG